MKTAKKFDSLWLGTLIGFLLPCLVLLLFYWSTYAYLTVPDFLRKMAFQTVLIKLLSLCAVVNLGGFYAFFQTQRDKSARGVILATLLIAIYVMIHKILGGTL